MNVRWTSKTLKITLLAGLAWGLAACTNGAAVTPPPCPDILIPLDGSQLTRFKPGPGRDIIDVLHEEQVSGFAHGCEYDTDATGAGDLLVQVVPAFESKRGPANQSNLIEFEYFIAIVDREKNLLEKKRFPAAIEFPSNMSRVLWQRADPINLTIPLKAGQSGADFTIFLGLQMTKDEVEYQRKIR